MHPAQRQFQIHATVWFAVNGFLFLIWAITGGGFPWFLIPAAAWGIGLAAHATAAYTHPIGRGDDEDDEIDSGPGYRSLGQ